jgi:hypothetical protein
MEDRDEERFGPLLSVEKMFRPGVDDANFVFMNSIVGRF